MAPADAGIGNSGVVDFAGTTSAGVSVCGIAGAGRSGSSVNGRCATLRTTFSELTTAIFRFRGGMGANVIGRVTTGIVLAAYDTLRGLATHTLMHTISVTLHGCQAVAKRPDFWTLSRRSP